MNKNLLKGSNHMTLKENNQEKQRNFPVKIIFLINNCKSSITFNNALPNFCTNKLLQQFSRKTYLKPKCDSVLQLYCIAERKKQVLPFHRKYKISKVL